MRRTILLAAIAAGTLACATGAKAEEIGFQLCNRTNLPAVYAKALNVEVTGAPGAYTGKEPLIESDGWYTLAPGECDVLWPGALRYQFYLVYAESRGSSRVWEGDKSVCVETGDFRIRAPMCPAGREQRDFIQVDTGDGYSFTYELR